jgi:hypothetical protein
MAASGAARGSPAGCILWDRQAPALTTDRHPCALAPPKVNYPLLPHRRRGLLLRWVLMLLALSSLELLL